MSTSQMSEGAVRSAGTSVGRFIGRRTSVARLDGDRLNTDRPPPRRARRNKARFYRAAFGRPVGRWAADGCGRPRSEERRVGKEGGRRWVRTLVDDVGM